MQSHLEADLSGALQLTRLACTGVRDLIIQVHLYAASARQHSDMRKPRSTRSGLGGNVLTRTGASGREVDSARAFTMLSCSTSSISKAIGMPRSPLALPLGFCLDFLMILGALSVMLQYTKSPVELVMGMRRPSMFSASKVKVITGCVLVLLTESMLLGHACLSSYTMSIH